jgi:hypothetical protein
MIELLPLRDECESELERDLLAAGRDFRASERAQAETLVALGLVKAPPRRTFSRALAVAASAVLVAAVASGGAVAAYRHHRALLTQRLALPIVTERTSAALPRSRAGENAGAVLPDEATPVSAANALPSADPPPPSPFAKTGARAIAGRAPLGGELAALEAAATAIAAGNAERGLALLDAYAKDYRRGRLGPEAEVLRIDALALSGQPGAAAKAAESFLERHPKSVLAARVRRYLPE